VVDAEVADAQRAHLHWVTDTAAGISRRRRGSSFSYLKDGTPIRDHQTLARIRALAVPPAWTDVWICPDPNGHIQATGRDARKRKQYRYHERWREIRDSNKYDRTIAFAQALPHIRARVDSDLRLRGLVRNRVLAAMVRLLDLTLIRVGNPEYAKDNKSYGLTTMRSSHVVIEGDAIRLSFRGKGGKRVAAEAHDRRVATVMQRCTSLPGEELFQYVDEDGEPHAVTSDDVNAYLREIAGDDFSAKDFRTWAGTVITAHALRTSGPSATAADEKRHVIEAVSEAAAQLGNTVAVCRRCYVHPQVFEAYGDGTLLQLRFGTGGATVSGSLRSDERAVLRLLRAGDHVRSRAS
jgi:DNA topoisomerase I